MGRRIVRTSSQDLKKLLLNPTGGRFLRPLDAFDQVYPGILLGDASTALSTCLLKELKVTHVLNAAHGKNDDYYGGFVNTSFSNYDQAGIKFMGVPALDSPSFYLRSYFKQGADFIEEALKSGGKVLIHCQCGISRSATLIAAYLMLKKGMDAQEALSTIRSHRSIFPNQGFLSQLSDLDYELKRTVDSQQTEKSRKSIEKEERKPLLDPVYSPSFHSDNRPMFSHSNYTPWTRPITRGGYPLTSNAYEIATKSRTRARSEERAARSLYDYTRSRSASPPPSSLRDYRATSIMPDSYYEDRIISAVPRTKFIEARTAPVLTSYESLSNPLQRNYYYTRTEPQTFTYSPRISARPYTDSYLKMRYAPVEDVGYTRSYSPRTSLYSSSITPYESYTSSSSFANRSYSTYTPISMPSRRYSTSSSLSSSVRYPAQYPATFRHSYGVGLKAY